MQIKELETPGRPAAVRPRGPQRGAVHRGRVLPGARAAHAGDAEGCRGRDGALQARWSAGPLTIGLVSTAKYFVPRLLARFHEEHPGVEVRLRVVGNREQLVALMHGGEVDLAVMGGAPQGDGHTAPSPSPRTRWSSSRRPATACCVRARTRWPPWRPTRSSCASTARARARRWRSSSREQRFDAAHRDGDVEQRDHQAGGDGRHGPELPVAAHHGAGAAQRAAAAAGHRRHAGDAHLERGAPAARSCCRRRPRRSATSCSSRARRTCWHTTRRCWGVAEAWRQADAAVVLRAPRPPCRRPARATRLDAQRTLRRGDRSSCARSRCPAAAAPRA